MNTFTLSLVLIVAILVSLLKDVIELRVKPGSALHDTIIRLVAIATGIALSFADYAINTANWQQGPALEGAAGRGLVAGIGAIVTYHLVSAGGGVWASLTPGEITTPYAMIQGTSAPLVATETLHTTAVTTATPATVTIEASDPAVTP